jgi:septal ring-binding cell division protein DamX
MLEGEIRDIDLVARLVELWREQFTGAIRFENDGIIKIIYFKSGDVLSASTNDRADSVDEILMKAGKVSRDHVKQALAKRKENETLGDTLLNLGFITRKELTWARRVQVVGVIRSISEWQAGSYTIVENYLPKRDEGTIFPLPQIIVELVVTDQDRSKYERALDSGSAIFDKAPDFEDMFGKLGFNEEAEAVTSQVDGLKTASEVAAASRQDEFNAYKLLHALTLLGLLTRVGQSEPAMAVADISTAAPEPVSHNSGTFEGVGVADAADAWSGEMPRFDLADDTGPGQVTTPLGTPAPPVLPPEPEPEPVVAAPEPKMPAWDLSPRGATPATAPAPEPPADAAEEPQWGFDEAQIETARKASVPVSSSPVPTPPARTRDYSSTASMAKRPTASRPLPKKKKKSYFPLIVTLMAVFIIAGISYFGFMWWQARNAPAPVVAAKPRPVVPKPVTPIATATETVALATAPTTATSAPPVTTTTATPVPPPMPVTRATTATPKPAPVNPGVSDRERYEAMAREFAASPNAKFTVQFEIVCEPSNITKALREGGTNVWFLPISLKGRSCYRVFWGRYQARDAAERAVGEVPASLREAKPAVVTVPQP